MSRVIARELRMAEGELIREKLRRNRDLIARTMSDQEDTFPRSIAMQLITQRKISKVIPVFYLALSGIRIVRFLSKRVSGKAHRLRIR